MARVWSLLLVLVCAAQSGCSRASKSSVSQISIIAPQGLHAKNGLSAMPSGRVACYGVNILGAGTTTNNTCSPPTGITAGYVVSGQALQASVAKNKTLTIELYLYLMPTGSTAACPAFTEAFSKANMANVYLVGTAANVSTSQDETNVVIEASFPGPTQNVAQQLGLGSSCVAYSAVNFAHPYGVSVDTVTMTDVSGVKMLARVGSAVANRQMTASDGSKIMIKRAGVVR